METARPFDTSVFRVYDIRGLAKKSLDGGFAFALGQSVAAFLRAKKKTGRLQLLVGRDARPFSEVLRDYLVFGILKAEKDILVLDLDLVTTPMHFFALNKLEVDGGVMVTASHNPPQDAGFKLFGVNAVPISANSGLLKIQELMRQAAPFDITHHAEHCSRWLPLSALNPYIEFLTNAAGKLSRPCSVVVDAGNGSAGPVVEALSKKTKTTFLPLFWEPDGRFPNRPPNPLEPLALEPLKQKIKKTGADFGAALDGDGDRVIFVDEKGDVVEPEFIFALLVKESLRARPGATVLVPVNSSRLIYDVVVEQGGVAVATKVGRSFLVQQMREQEALLGGEISGHYYFREFFGGDSGILALLKIMKIFSLVHRPFSELVGQFWGRYFKSKELNFRVVAWEPLKQILAEKFKDGLQEEIDGLTVRYPRWWFNIRPSNTESFVRLVVEAKLPSLLEKKVKELTKLIEIASRGL